MMSSLSTFRDCMTFYFMAAYILAPVFALGAIIFTLRGFVRRWGASALFWGFPIAVGLSVPTAIISGLLWPIAMFIPFVFLGNTRTRVVPYSECEPERFTAEVLRSR
jgi:hypothetical protein